MCLLYHTSNTLSIGLNVNFLCHSSSTVFANFSLSSIQTFPLINTEEKKPATIPTIMGNENSLIEGTLRIKSMTIVKRVVRDVKTERRIVWRILFSTIRSNGSPVISLLFSRIRSKMMIVALIE